MSRMARGMRTEDSRPLSFVGAALWTIGVTLLLAIAVVITESARPGAATDLVSITACHVLSYSTIIFVMLRIYEPETPVRRVVALRPASAASIVLAGGLGASVYPALNVLDTLVARRFPLPPDAHEHLATLLATPTLGRRVFLAASLLVLMPIAEEVFFRGVLFGGLRRGRNAGVVILGTAVCFAAARAEVPSFASVLALGLLLGWLRDRCGSIVPTVVAQAAFFAVPIVPILRGRDPLADEVYSRAVILGGLVAAVICAALVEWLSARARAVREAEE